LGLGFPVLCYFLSKNNLFSFANTLSHFVHNGIFNGLKISRYFCWILICLNTLKVCCIKYLTNIASIIVLTLTKSLLTYTFTLWIFVDIGIFLTTILAVHFLRNFLKCPLYQICKIFFLYPIILCLLYVLQHEKGVTLDLMLDLPTLG